MFLLRRKEREDVKEARRAGECSRKREEYVEWPGGT